MIIYHDVNVFIQNFSAQMLKILSKMNSKKLILAICLSYGITFSCAQTKSSKDRYNATALAVSKDSLKISAQRLMKKHKIPGMSMLLMKSLDTIQTLTFGVQQKGKETPIDQETVFSAGSVSKVVTAILALRLVDSGKLALDTDINTYLKDWKVEKNQFNKDQPVTIRHILSHTAGFSVHGFADYYPGEALPTSTIAILQGKKPAKNNEVKLIFSVGEKYQYSGGGTTVLQKIIEDVTGLPFHKAAAKEIFEPLGLKRSSFLNPLPEAFGNIAKAHDEKGKPEALPRGYQAMPEAAASGLWITPTDLYVILKATMTSQQDTGSKFLSKGLVEDMITAEENSHHGLGPRINTENGKHIVEHGGANDSYRSLFYLFWKQKVGFIIMTNGNKGRDLIYELKPLIEKHLMKTKVNTL